MVSNVMRGGPTEVEPEPRSARPFVLAGARITHDRTSIDVLEAASHAEPGERVETLLDRPGVSEAAVIQTCNRIEEYVVAESADRGREALADVGAAGAPDAVVAMDHSESLRHLLRVAAGLESQVLGEDQILGQVREAYRTADTVGGLGPVLEDGLLKAIHVGERARTETAINEGIVSLGSAAVDLAARERGFDGRTVVVGAGEVARTVLASLADRAVGELEVLNRSRDRAAALAADAGAAWAGLDDLATKLATADVVIVSTGSTSPVIDRASLEAADETFVVDLGQPRDVSTAAAALPAVTVHDLDDLRSVTRRTHEERREAAEAVEAIVEEEYENLVESYKRKRADAVVRGMYRGAERMKEREVRRALGRLDDLEEEQQAVVRDLADALVSRLLAVPAESLRDAAANDDVETLIAAIELFDPGAEDQDFFADVPTGVLEAALERQVASGDED